MSFSDTIQKGTILHKKYSNIGSTFITQLLSGENAGILWHRSRMTRIMTTHDWRPLAFACGKKTKSAGIKGALQQRQGNKAVN